MTKGVENQNPTYAVVTNSTYDGLCYDVNRVVEELSKSVPRVHFDEAWYAYAKFHKIYRGRFAMDVPDDMVERPTIFSVQSTHKMLAAFSIGLNGSYQTQPARPARLRSVQRVIHDARHHITVLSADCIARCGGRHDGRACRTDPDVRDDSGCHQLS